MITIHSRKLIRFFWGTHDRFGTPRTSYPSYVTASWRSWLRWGLE